MSLIRRTRHGTKYKRDWINWQRDTAAALMQKAEGEVVFVATSMYACSEATGYWNDYVVETTAATIRGFEKRGLIKIIDKFWRGAELEILNPSGLKEIYENA